MTVLGRHQELKCIYGLTLCLFTCVDDLPETEVGDPVEEGEYVGAGLLHAEQDEAVVLLGVVGHDGDEEVRVQGVQVARRVVQQQHHWKEMI